MTERSYPVSSEGATSSGRTKVQRLCTCGPVGSIVTINSVPIHALTPASAFSRIDQMLTCSATHIVNQVSADPIVIAGRDESFRESLKRADLNLPDGMGVVWAARMLGVRDIRGRVYGPDFMIAVMEKGIERGLRPTLVGGSPSTPEKLVRVLSDECSGLKVTSAYSPPIRSITKDGVLYDLSRLEGEADIIWVGLGTRKQQLWAELACKSGKARIISTVGAAFDFIAGTKPKMPRWMQNAGLEWLFRLGTEPRRLARRYLLGNPAFIWSVAVARWRSRRGPLIE